MRMRQAVAALWYSRDSWEDHSPFSVSDLSITIRTNPLPPHSPYPGRPKCAHSPNILPSRHPLPLACFPTPSACDHTHHLPPRPKERLFYQGRRCPICCRATRNNSF